MSKTVLIALVVVCGGLLAVAGSASAQWSGPIVVTNEVEPYPGLGQNRGGVSAARCGSNVVVGFGDFEAGIGSSAGYSASSDGGVTFIDRGVLPSSDEIVGALGDGPGGDGTTVDHDLSVACNGPLHFYYAATLFEFNRIEECPAQVGLCSSISVSVSSDGGQSWGLPMVVDRKNADNHQLQSPSIAADPTSPRIYVAYLDENSSPLDFSFPKHNYRTKSSGFQQWRRDVDKQRCRSHLRYIQ